MARKFGIEIETVSRISHAEMAACFEAAGLPVDHAATRRYSSARYDLGWQMKHDGSISGRGDGYALEIVSPVLEWTADGREQVKTAVATAKAHSTVNRSCGLHVHVSAAGMTAETRRRLIALWDAFEDVVFTYLPPSRRNNHFCARGHSATNRYHALNLVPVSSKGTVEFRCHHASLNASKILSWVSLCVAIMEHAFSDKPIPREKIRPQVNAGSVSESVTLSFRGHTYQATRLASGGFSFETRVFGSLHDLAFEIIRRSNPNRTKPVSDWFLRQIVTEGSTNGRDSMFEICEVLGVEQEYRTYLSDRFQAAINQWGFDISR